MDFNFIVMVNWIKTSLASSCIYLPGTAQLMVIYHATRYRVYEKTNQSPSDEVLSRLLNLNLAATDWNKGGMWQDAVIMKNGNLQSTSFRCPKVLNNKWLCVSLKTNILTNFTLLIGLICACIFVKLNHHVKFAQNATNLIKWTSSSHISIICIELLNFNRGI